MRNILLIGRTNWLLDSAKLIHQEGFNIVGIITSRESSESKVTVETLKSYAEEIDTTFIYAPKLTKDLFYKNFANIDLHIGISVNYTGIISKEIIELFEYGVLNAHGGDLPRFRGNACQAWALINAEEHIGLCIHKMIGGELDSGKIISRRYYPVNINTRIGQVYDFFDENIPTLFLESVKKLANDKSYFLEEQSKDKKDILRCYPRLPEDGRIIWDKSNAEIIRLVNATSEPYSGAFCFFNGVKFHVWRASLFDDGIDFLGIPGQVAKILTTGQIIVLTGKGKIIIEEVGYDGFNGKPANIIKSLRSRLS